MRSLCRFDFAVTWLLLAGALYVLYPYADTNPELVRYLILLRCLRLGAVLADLPRFRKLVKVFSVLFPAAVPLFSFFFLSLYVFAAAGVAMFGGLIYANAPGLQVIRTPASAVMLQCAIAKRHTTALPVHACCLVHWSLQHAAVKRMQDNCSAVCRTPINCCHQALECVTQSSPIVGVRGLAQVMSRVSMSSVRSCPCRLRTRKHCRSRGVSTLTALTVSHHLLRSTGATTKSGVQVKNNPLVDAYVGNDYWTLNFNDMASGWYVLFSAVIVSYLTEIAEAVAGTSAWGHWTKWFFIAHFVVNSLIVANCVLAFVVDLFIMEDEQDDGDYLELEERYGAKRIKVHRTKATADEIYASMFRDRVEQIMRAEAATP